MQEQMASDARIKAMLEAFAGPDAPLSPPVRSKRRVSRGTLILVLAGLVGVGLAVPAALALLGQWKTPKQFFADPSQPRYVKQLVRETLKEYNCPNCQPKHLRLVAINYA